MGTPSVWAGPGVPSCLQAASRSASVICPLAQVVRPALFLPIFTQYTQVSPRMSQLLFIHTGETEVQEAKTLNQGHLRLHKELAVEADLESRPLACMTPSNCSNTSPFGSRSWLFSKSLQPHLL